MFIFVSARGKFFVDLTISLIGVINVNLMNAYTDQEEDLARASM